MILGKLTMLAVLFVVLLLASRAVFRSEITAASTPFSVHLASATIALAGVIGIAALRVGHFLGVPTLLQVAIGLYREPITRRKVLAVVDMNRSADVAERLGTRKARTLLDKLLVDLQRAIVESRGVVQLYRGDGLVVAWDWDVAMRDDAILRAVDGMFAGVARDAASYMAEFGAVPTFRVAIHGGDVVLRETGGVKRGIGIYEDVVDIAARLEEACRLHQVPCIVSGRIARQLDAIDDRFRHIGADRAGGSKVPLDIYEYRVGRHEKTLSRPMAE